MPEKRTLLILSLLLIACSIGVSAESESSRWPYYSQFVDVELEMGSGIHIMKKSPGASLDLASANVSLTPMDTERQKVLSFESVPKPTTRADYLEYIWHKPQTTELDFSIKATMRGYNTYTKIPKKVSFPIVHLPPDILEYTEETKNINSDDELIHEVASKIAEGEDDLYKVVHELALWTKENIEYNLSTLTADVSQPASWVLQNREGVCDELTSLFIALLRSLGIPARFVSGIAYTDLPEFSQNWGGHGWAEVYFPGYGWTDWDVTYGELGSVDPTHFTLKESLDSDEPATVYTWQGRGIDATAKQMTLKGKLLNKFGRVPPRVKINASMRYKSTGFSSYNIVQADVTNLEDSYISTTIFLAPTQNIEIVSESAKITYFEPAQTKRLYWIVKVDDILDDNYIYTFPMSVISTRNVTSKTSFVSIGGESRFTKEQMEKVISSQEQESRTKTEARLALACLADKDIYYGYDSPEVTCAVKNTGNTRLTGLRMCLETDCRPTDLKINQEKLFDYTIERLNQGTNALVLTAGNDVVSKSFSFEIYVMDDPKITVKDMRHPLNVTYDDNFTIDLLLGKVSGSNPQNVLIDFGNGAIEETWRIEEMENDQRYLVAAHGSTLRIGKNTFNLTITYEDMNGRGYEATDHFTIHLVDVTLWQKIMILFNSLDQRLRKLFK